MKLPESHQVELQVPIAAEQKGRTAAYGWAQPVQFECPEFYPGSCNSGAEGRESCFVSQFPYSKRGVSNVYQTLTVCDDSEQLKEHLDMCKVPVAYEGLRRHLSKSNQTQCD